MTNLPPPDGKKPKISSARITVWAVAAAIGLYLVVSGLLGIGSGG